MEFLNLYLNCEYSVRFFLTPAINLLAKENIHIIILLLIILRKSEYEKMRSINNSF